MAQNAPQGMELILTGADGNCYPHSVSHGAFGTEDRHEEIQVRIIFTTIRKEKLFLNNAYLSNGFRHQGCQQDR